MWLRARSLEILLKESGKYQQHMKSKQSRLQFYIRKASMTNDITVFRSLLNDTVWTKKRKIFLKSITKYLNLIPWLHGKRITVHEKKSVPFIRQRCSLLSQRLCLILNSPLFWYDQELACILNRHCDTGWDGWVMCVCGCVYVCRLIAVDQVQGIMEKKVFRLLFCPFIYIIAQCLQLHICLHLLRWHHSIFRWSLGLLSQILDLVLLTGWASVSVFSK